MKPTALLDHTALAALFRADPFFTGLCTEASRGTGRVLSPSLSVLAAERQLSARASMRRLCGSRKACRSPRHTRWMQWIGPVTSKDPH